MNAVASTVPSIDRTDPAALFELVKDEFESIDLADPLPRSVRVGIAVGKSNGDGIEPRPEVVRLMVLADRDTITFDECVALADFLHER